MDAPQRLFVQPPLHMVGMALVGVAVWAICPQLPTRAAAVLQTALGLVGLRGVGMTHPHPGRMRLPGPHQPWHPQGGIARPVSPRAGPHLETPAQNSSQLLADTVKAISTLGIDFSGLAVRETDPIVFDHQFQEVPIPPQRDGAALGLGVFNQVIEEFPDALERTTARSWGSGGISPEGWYSIATPKRAWLWAARDSRAWDRPPR